MRWGDMLSPQWGWGGSAASSPCLNTRLCTRAVAQRERVEKKKDPVWSPEIGLGHSEVLPFVESLTRALTSSFKV